MVYEKRHKNAPVYSLRRDGRILALNFLACPVYETYLLDAGYFTTLAAYDASTD